MKSYIIIILVLCGMLLIGCDDRGSDNPEMTVTASAQYGDFVYNKTGFNEMEFDFKLKGPQSKIAYRRINVDIANNMGNFIGTGTNNSLVTDGSGHAIGRYLAGDGYGTANVNFVLEMWPNQKATFNIPIIDFPRLDSLVTDKKILPPNGISTAKLTAYISSANAELEGIKVLFERSSGSLLNEVAEADMFGLVTNRITAPSHETLITVTARLELLPVRYKSVNIRCETQD